MILEQENFKTIKARQLERVPNTVDKRDDSIISTALGPESWYLEAFILELIKIRNGGRALTVVGQDLDYKAAERGVMRNPATFAIRQGEFDVMPALGARFASLSGADSLNFAVTKQTGIDPATGYFLCELTCETAGSVGNDYTGSLLPITFIADLNFAQMVDIIIQGSDEQDDDGLRQKYLDSLKAESFAGNISYYRQLLLAHENVGAVQVYPVWNGGGTVKISFLDANFNPATSGLIEEIQNFVCPLAPDDNPTQYGLGHAPIGAAVTVATATPLEIEVGLTIDFVSGYSAAAVREKISKVTQEYFLSIRKNWGRATVTTGEVLYIVSVYTSRILADCMQIEGILNVSIVTLNGAANDLQLTQFGTLQQIPTLSGVVINGA